MKYIAKDLIGNESAWVQIMAWHQAGNEPLSKQMNDDPFQWPIYASPSLNLCKENTSISQFCIIQWYSYRFVWQILIKYDQ